MKGYRDNGGGAGSFGARNKTVYDDVFGGPPKFGATTLPPRLEDYTEIFQGFHASRGSSIPVLDLPPPCNDSDDVWFDVQSSKLDYSEVFGGFNGLDFAISYEELFKISKVGDGDSSDDVWTPAQSDSLSDELDPYASLEMNQHVSTSDPIELFGVQLQKEPNFEAGEDLLNGIINDSQFLDGPSETENEKLFPLANNDHSSSNHFGGVTERKQLKKSLSQPLDSVCAGNRPHLSVSDLSLKTQPSNLPPPSRPPPALSTKKGDFDSFSSKLKTSKSYAFEKMRGDRSPPYFDVEIDASSSAAADAAAMKDAVEQAQAKLRSAKELMDRKKEGLQSRSKNNVGDKKERVNGDERFNGFGCKITKGSLEKDNTRRRHEAIDENQQMKMKDVEGSVAQNTCKPREAEKTCLISQQRVEIKTPSEADESESYDNLIEIQLKDNDMDPVVKLVGDNEKVVNKDQVKHDNERPLYDWEDYDDTSEKDDYDVALQEAFEKEHMKEVMESKEHDEKEVQKSVPPEIVITTQSEEDYHDHERENHERIIEDPYNWEENESDINHIISETISQQDENKKEQTLNHNEKILQEEDEIKAKEGLEQTLNYKIETINEMDCNSEEDRNLQKDHERDESQKMKDMVSEIDESSTGEISEASDVVYTIDDNEILQTTEDIQHDITTEKNEVTPQIPIYPTNPEKNEATPQIPIHPTNPEKNEATPQTSSLPAFNQNNCQGVKFEGRETNGVNIVEETPMENDYITSKLKNAINFTHNLGVKRTNGLEGKDTTTTSNVGSRSLGRKDANDKLEREREIENERIRKLEEEREIENERIRKLEEERERQIEREKDRMAVDRATLEARERAFSETKERAERAAVERATAEYRQRALAEARERLEKACAEARERSLAEKTMEGRQRVEKATAEARERAERSVDDKFSNSRNMGLRYPQNTAPYNGGESESPQRCKARLERHQRTANRAAKALAEKNMRDLLAQKEQAERNRLAEGLDAEVKRWCSGKQGNLRALLSTLQYILGSESGWQPIPLTEVITTAAVKRAYRKATLCVHPDKLQQRGASIQHKYICEKVFDLLKEAWNKFNSEER